MEVIELDPCPSPSGGDIIEPEEPVGNEVFPALGLSQRLGADPQPGRETSVVVKPAIPLVSSRTPIETRSAPAVVSISI